MNLYATTNPNITEREEKHTQIVRELAARGMVLLKNQGCLPLKAGSRVALYGNGARYTLHAGIGAAGTICRHVCTIEEGLSDAGIKVTTGAYLDRYDETKETAETAHYEMLWQRAQNNLLRGVIAMYHEPFKMPDQSEITETDMPKDVDTAIYVLSRNSGEDTDRDAGEGDYLLSKIERKNIEILAVNFKHFIILLNVCGPIDTKFIREIDNIGAVVVVNLGGNLTGGSVADVLTGKITPEGKLSDTWAENFIDYPSSAAILKQPRDDLNDVYWEGVFAGYRYFDSFGIAPAYPFGYGMSYTSFDIQILSPDTRKDCFVFPVRVTNIGNEYEGREVVQLYVSAPQGKLSKPYQELKGFEKTKVLEPRSSEVIEIILPVVDLASYSEEKAAWVLEPGAYYFRIGNSSRNTHIAAVWNLDKEVITARCRNLFAPDQDVPEIKAELSRFYTYESEEDEKKSAIHISIDLSDISVMTYDYTIKKSTFPVPADENIILFENVLTGKSTLEAFIGQLTPEELCCVCVGDAWETCPKQEEGEDFIATFSLNGPGTTGGLNEKYGLPKFFMSDGGAGIRALPWFEMDDEGNCLTDGLLSIGGTEKLPYNPPKTAHITKYYQYPTALPIPTMLAQTWDKNLLRRSGNLVGEEMVGYDVDVWLAPAMNNHRTPLCGRNFEYFSEDPLLTGIAAAEMGAGVESIPGRFVCFKHFACNNQEYNRHSLNVHVSERSLREIYLRSFQIAIEAVKPGSVMSSYNLINGTHTANYQDLLTDVLRCEWGFNGFVMTDFGTTRGPRSGPHAASVPYLCISAGNDLIMSGAREDVDELIESYQKGDLKLSELQWCAKNILTILVRKHLAAQSS